MSESATQTAQAKTSRFAGFEREERKPWDDGWYSGVVIAEYETSGNFARVHKTEDVPTQKGDSRNLKLCITLVNGNETKNMNHAVNYRPECLDPERMEELRERKAAKEQLKGTDFRDAMSLSNFHELERAGFALDSEENGGFNVDALIGVAADFYIGTRVRKDPSNKMSDDRAVTKEEKEKASDEDRKNWFHKITQIAAVDTKVKR